MDTVLQLRALTKHYSSHRAVNAISLTIERGEFFSLVGPSGCGKTTTLRLIAGFEEPTSGEIFLNNRLVAGLPPYRRNVSTVFQNYALFPHLTVAQNVSFGMERQTPRPSRATVADQVRQILALVQLTGKENRLPSQISGGEKQRVALARSLVLEPEVLLLDEPLAALDPNLRKQMRAELKTIQRRVGIAFLFITHDREEALSLSDKMAVMNRGVLEQIGSPQELYRAPASQFVAEFLGNVNWIQGAAVRPEALRISKEFPGERLRSFEAAVESSTFFGNCVHVHAKLHDGQTCTAELSQTDAPYSPGERVHVSWRPEDELRITREA